MSSSLHKTLVIRLSSIGDIVLSSLLVRVLRKRFPESRIDYLVRSEYADLVRHNPHISGVIAFPSGGTFSDLKRVRREIVSNGYDLIVDIHDSLRSRYICFGARRTVRINKRKLARFLLVNFKWNTYRYFGGAPSVAERYLEPVREFGVEDDGNGLEVFVTNRDTVRVREILESSGVTTDSQIFGICPSAKHGNKMWLKERFAQVAAGLMQTAGTVIIFGSVSEVRLCEDVKQLISAMSPAAIVVNLAGRLSLLETAALMDTCSIIVSNDSGLMHIASARGRPTVAVFGPTTSEFGFFPLGPRSRVVEHPSLSCRPCTHIGLPECPKGHFKCMRDISADQVLEAARELLSK